jgi:hypothetical protein
MSDETTQLTRNAYELRNLPWMKQYYRYDDGLSDPWILEYWTCKFKVGYKGAGPCYDY